MTRTVDFFFSIGSPWAYIGLDPMRDLAERHDVRFDPKPIPLIEANGGIYAKNRPDARRAYWFKDLARWADVRGKTLAMEGRAALSPPDPAAFTVIAAARDGADWFSLTERLQRAFWEEKADIGRADVRKSLAQEAGLDGAHLTARESDTDVEETWRDNIATAEAAGVFGSPTFRYGGELFWGQDSLPFLEKALTSA
ncbi:2-hydroxychromene-2-carboxylate isomerase [Salipiger sp. IMCC34102]|uniref:2-hydroxychromene-2-carboxylate isomerase n=1 Tax=Salipiger sp. IMCC34102 TaxID=2510647 RepID=UPI00101BD08C|nr:2-hydroxychromene-2-carboxylate isomerase [Salipiger sp. IMCC34102]RYH01255.1 2-hydroxychromene-2-carboxylate isomerase [Salipiger sp. IMCC34102]